MQEELPSSEPASAPEPIQFLESSEARSTWPAREAYVTEQTVSASIPAPHLPAKAMESPRPATSRHWPTIFGWLLAAVVVLVGARFFVPNLAEEIQYAMTRGRQRAEYEAAGVKLASLPLNDLSQSFQLVSQRVGPSVVHINTTSLETVEADDPADGLLGPRRRPRQGQGSGVIMEDTGYILTNYHVIRDSSRVDVHLSDGRTVEALEIGHDRETDLALLKIDAEQLIAAEWGDSGHLEVGSLVWAVGSPFGLERSITFGILSAKNRAGQAGTIYQDFLQTDAAVNPGNSGGPLVDAQGRVIGINTAIVGQTYQGISFAIPSDVARDVYRRLKSEHRVARGWLGVSLDVVDADRAESLGLPDARGAFIAMVVDEFGPSPAGRAGVQTGDVIVRFDGVEIDGPMTLSRQVARTAVGSKARVVLYRGGRKMSFEVVLAERPSDLTP